MRWPVRSDDRRRHRRIGVGGTEAVKHGIGSEGLSRLAKMARLRHRPLLVAALLLGLGVFGVVWGELPRTPDVPYPTYEYDGRFTLARLRFEPTQWGPSPYFTWGLDLKWNHDYPQAEQNFSRILDEITSIVPRLDGGNILEISDPRLFEHPFAYICEVRYWNPPDEDMDTLREYLLKGGFLIIDDFLDPYPEAGNPALYNFRRQMHRLLPGYTLVELDLNEPVFHSFFQLDTLDFRDPQMGDVESAIYGIYEDNDPSKRLMVIANYNLDIGDYWEWSDQDFYPLDLTERGFEVGVNYVIYSLTR